MTVLIVELEVADQRINPSATGLIVTLNESLRNEIRRLVEMIKRNELRLIEGSIQAADGTGDVLLWTTADLDNVPDETSAEDALKLVEEHPGTASFPKILVFQNGFMFNAYDCYANSPTELNSELIPLTLLDKPDTVKALKL